jgi:hypothetical protein
MPNPSVRTWLYMGMAVVLVAGNLYAFWPFFAADKQMQAFCAGVPAGTSFIEFQKRVVAEGYTLTLAPGAPARVDDPRSLGRRYCELPVDATGAVVAR